MTSSVHELRLKRVLLIDDDAVSREVMAMVLEMRGFAVEAAEDGAEAVARIDSGADGSVPEVILMDTQMPGLSGLELIQALRRCTKARLIAISGSEVSEAIRQATDGFLLKPFEAEGLVALLEPGNREPEKTNAGDAPAADLIDLAVLIDQAVLGKLKAMMPTPAVEELYSAVASDMKARLVALRAAMDSGSAPEVRRIAHAIKGGCAMVGLSGAAGAASRLETGNRRGTWQKELLQLNGALIMLQSILYDRLLK
jgi:CheY-like chemotaxis protein